MPDDLVNMEKFIDDYLRERNALHLNPRGAGRKVYDEAYSAWSKANAKLVKKKRDTEYYAEFPEQDPEVVAYQRLLYFSYGKQKISNFQWPFQCPKSVLKRLEPMFYAVQDADDEKIKSVRSVLRAMMRLRELKLRAAVAQ